MRLILFTMQIAMLAAGFSSNRADAMVGAAIFCVLAVVIVFFDAKREQRFAAKSFSTKGAKP